MKKVRHRFIAEYHVGKLKTHIKKNMFYKDTCTVKANYQAQKKWVS